MPPKAPVLDPYVIPSIAEISNETRMNKKRVEEEAFAKLLLRSRPFFEDSVAQIHKAKDAGINECSVHCAESDIATVIISKYSEESYEVKYNNPHVRISWPI